MASKRKVPAAFKANAAKMKAGKGLAKKGGAKAKPKFPFTGKASTPTSTAAKKRAAKLKKSK